MCIHTIFAQADIYISGADCAIICNTIYHCNRGRGGGEGGGSCWGFPPLCPLFQRELILLLLPDSISSTSFLSASSLLPVLFFPSFCFLFPSSCLPFPFLLCFSSLLPVFFFPSSGLTFPYFTSFSFLPPCTFFLSKSACLPLPVLLFLPSSSCLRLLFLLIFSALLPVFLCSSSCLHFTFFLFFFFPSFSFPFSPFLPFFFSIVFVGRIPS